MTVSEENAWFPVVRAKLQAEEAICRSGVPYPIFRLGFVMETLDRRCRGPFALVVGLVVLGLWFLLTRPRPDARPVVGRRIAAPALSGR